MKVAIVSAYNNLPALGIEFLDAMLKHLPPPDYLIQTKIIMVNGGCPVKIEHPAIWKRPDLDQNYGFCKVLNVGLKEIPEDSDFVFFVGNDSFPVDNSWLPRLIDLQRTTGAWMVCPANDNPGMHHYRHFYRESFPEYWEVNFFPSIAWLMPYWRFKQVGLLDEDYPRTGMYADNDYCCRIKKAGGRIIVSKNILLRHLLSAEGKVLGTQSQDMEPCRNIFISKWGLEALP